MPLVIVDAQAPWGPVRLRTFESIGEMLLSATTPPAHIEDVGDRDPAEVVRLAVRTMQPTSGGWYADGVAKAANLVKEAASSISARAVAVDPGKASPGQPASHCGPIASDGEAEPEFSVFSCAPAREAAPGNRTKTGARRPGAEVDAREIRGKLGMSQPEFARAFGLKVATVRDWDQGRTAPDGAARSLLLLIEHRPSMVRDILGRYGVPVGSD